MKNTVEKKKIYIFQNVFVYSADWLMHKSTGPKGRDDVTVSGRRGGGTVSQRS